MISTKDEFMVALNGANGDLDAWLEVHSEAECGSLWKSMFIVSIPNGTLPKLPPPARYAPNGREPENFTEQQMQAYARTAIAAAGPNAALVEALKDFVADITERFDMASPSTNPGIKSCVENARTALAAAGVKEPS